jgi:hypothetical protein
VETVLTPTENIDINDYFSKTGILIRKKSANLAALQHPRKMGGGLDRSEGRSANRRPLAAVSVGCEKNTL